jgi:hypothetical protein
VRITSWYHLQVKRERGRGFVPEVIVHYIVKDEKRQKWQNDSTSNSRRKATIDGISLNKAINVMVRGYVMGKINVMKMMEDDQ